MCVRVCSLVCLVACVLACAFGCCVCLCWMTVRFLVAFRLCDWQLVCLLARLLACLLVYKCGWLCLLMSCVGWVVGCVFVWVFNCLFARLSEWLFGCLFVHVMFTCVRCACLSVGRSFVRLFDWRSVCLLARYSDGLFVCVLGCCVCLFRLRVARLRVCLNE